MAEFKIKLTETNQVKEFVNAAERCEYDINVFYNRFIIDAKSILGVLSLGLNRELTVQCIGEADAQFTDAISKFAVA
ncbi:MAG: HPr family phosphocarrier protein [Lachnospiraceae bacterium]|nr:HPr family phosphocarrier protein [Lachnospiraceae bacterium]